jgi:hypothetical protein
MFLRGAPGGDLQADRFAGAGIETGAAVAARLGVDLRLAIGHGDGLQRTSLDTLLTTGAFLRIDNCCH